MEFGGIQAFDKWGNNKRAQVFKINLNSGEFSLLLVVIEKS